MFNHVVQDERRRLGPFTMGLCRQTRKVVEDIYKGICIIINHVSKLDKRGTKTEEGGEKMVRWPEEVSMCS